MRTCHWVDEPVSGDVDLRVGLLPSVHVYKPLEERVPVHTEEQAHPPVHIHARACGCKSGFHLLPIGSWAGGD